MQTERNTTDRQPLFSHSVVVRLDPTQHRLQRRIVLQPVPGLLVRRAEGIQDPLVRDGGEFLDGNTISLDLDLTELMMTSKMQQGPYMPSTDELGPKLQGRTPDVCNPTSQWMDGI